ncbi:hypothetical protein FOZ63_006040, partial [Perkinsus olseni]
DEAPETEVPGKSDGMLDEGSTESEGEVTPEGNENDSESEREEEGTSIADNEQEEPAGVEATDDAPDEGSTESGDGEDELTAEGSEDDVSSSAKEEEASEDSESKPAADGLMGESTGIEATDDTPDESSSGDEEDQAGDEDTAGEGSENQTSEDNREGGATEGYLEGDEVEPVGGDDEEEEGGTEEPKDGSNTVEDSSEEEPSFEGFEDTSPPNDESDPIDQPSSTSARWSSAEKYPEAPLPPTFPAADELVNFEEDGHGEHALESDDDEVILLGGALMSLTAAGSRVIPRSLLSVVIVASCWRNESLAPVVPATEPEASSLRGYNSDSGDQEEDGVPEGLPGFEDADEVTTGQDVHHLARLSSGIGEGFSPGDEESSGHGEPRVRHFSEDNRVDRYK